ncbi:alpha-1,2-mannosidase [Coprinopsis sp. MPI-PUGE-AT-0042]|nr:alpha-1,2-mannosidase [Coprinopsis sp. MPI-PUGE-AT-0042]
MLSVYLVSAKSNLEWVNLLIGTTGKTPNGSGGMIPSVAPPFGMTRWVAQTQVSYVSATPYNASWALEGGDQDNTKIHGFMGTRQPAIWMGESGSIAVAPGVLVSEPREIGPQPTRIRADFEGRGLPVVLQDGKRTEVISPNYYNVLVDDLQGGTVLGEMSATSRVGHLRYTFQGPDHLESEEQTQHPENGHLRRQRHPYILIDVARPSIITSTPSNVTYPPGSVTILPHGANELNGPFEICGYSTERQDTIITPISGQKAAEGFKGYFCARFSAASSGRQLGGIRGNRDVVGYGAIQNGTVHIGKIEMEGPLLSAFVFLPDGVDSVDVRVGTSFISVEQARSNLDEEVKEGTSLEATSTHVKSKWEALFARASIKVGGDEDDEEAVVLKEVWWTALAHALQYPSEQDEGGRYWSGYDGKVHQVVKPEGAEGGSYTGYSIWDTYRAIWGFQILFVPERIPGMIQSMLADYRQSGWLPMWKNIVETNIMIGTHADSMIAEAVLKNITGFDKDLAWEAVWKDCTVPPQRDWEVEYADREEHVDYEVRAGLTSVYALEGEGKGWVADDVHSESASRTSAYAYDDFSAYALAKALGKPKATLDWLYKRAMRTPFTLYNDETGFMEARNADGSWAGEDRGWTEGDKWAYTFDVVHAIPELIERRGGKIGFVKSLEQHFDEGHNDHANEPSHHIPYLYSLSGAAYKAQERVREIAKENYNNKPNGLSGNEDCGQMSAWFMFSAMGFYPVNPVSGEYVVGSPFFEQITLNLPNPSQTGTSTRVQISAPGARTKPYIRSLSINGSPISQPVINHADLFASEAVQIVFEMSETVEEWGNEVEVLQALGVKAAWMDVRVGDEEKAVGRGDEL